MTPEALPPGVGLGKGTITLKCTAPGWEGSLGRPQRAKKMEETGFSFPLPDRIFIRHSGVEKTSKCG